MCIGSRLHPGLRFFENNHSNINKLILKIYVCRATKKATQTMLKNWFNVTYMDPIQGLAQTRSATFRDLCIWNWHLGLFQYNIWSKGSFKHHINGPSHSILREHSKMFSVTSFGQLCFWSFCFVAISTFWILKEDSRSALLPCLRQIIYTWNKSDCFYEKSN